MATESSGGGRWTITRRVDVVSLVVRLWPGPDGTREWRGEVRHVPTGRSVRFASLSQLQWVVEAFLEDERCGKNKESEDK